jgi:hypothetical protein
MFKKGLLYLLLVAACFSASAQKREYGVFLGTSYYVGELNPSRHFSGVAQPAGGLIFRHNINTRYAWKFSGMYGKLQADDHLTTIGLNAYRNLSFKASVIEFSSQIEFNFMQYGTRMSDDRYSPYIFCGLSLFRTTPEVKSLEVTEATAVEESYTGQRLTSVAFPFGLGMKFMLPNGINIGLEWSMRKTFTDELDAIDNQYQVGNVHNRPVEHRQLIGFQKGNGSNNDWYSFAGIILSYRPGPKKNACPGLD